MILADKIMCLRKQQGWSQEELANRLNVSRQSVSKWESEQSVPEMDKIVMLSEIFNVSTDYLLKEDMREDCREEHVQKPYVQEVETVTLRNDEVDRYLSLSRVKSKLVAYGVSLCIFSPLALIFLTQVDAIESLQFSFETGMAIGLITLFLCVGIAVALFIKSGTVTQEFEHLNGKSIVMSVSDKENVISQKDRFKGTLNGGTTIGVLLIIMGVVPLMIGGLYDISELSLILLLVLFLLVLNFGVHLLVRVSMIQDGFKSLLNTGEFTKKSKEVEKVTERIGSIYWPLVVAIYLLWSFLTNDWGRTWLVWPVAGVLFAVVPGISSFFVDKK